MKNYIVYFITKDKKFKYRQYHIRAKSIAKAVELTLKANDNLTIVGVAEYPKIYEKEFKNKTFY